MFERFPLRKFSAKDPAFLEMTRQTSRDTEKVLYEPGVTFLLGFLIKSCGEMCYFYGITHFLTSNVDSGEPYQGRNCAFTATEVKDYAVVCLPFTEDPNVILSNVWHYSAALWGCICSLINFCTWPVWRRIGRVDMGYFISESYTLSIINSFKITSHTHLYTF